MILKLNQRWFLLALLLLISFFKPSNCDDGLVFSETNNDKDDNDVEPSPDSIEFSASAVQDKIVTIPVLQGEQPPQAVLENCRCVPVAWCTDGAGDIDPRVANTPTCAQGHKYCCNIAIPTCGVPEKLPHPNYTPKPGEANYAEFPWHAVLLSSDNVYLGGGALIDSLHVVTAAHKVYESKLPMKVRLGEYDASSDSEPLKALEIGIHQIIIHSEFNSVNLQNDIALVKLSSPVDLKAYPHIRSICLPSANTSFANQRCWVSGFGVDSFQNGKFSTIMKKVDMPVLDPVDCQNKLRKTRLGRGFILNHNSFVCAGGEAGKDACTGDGGSPMVCSGRGTNDQWSLVGLVAYGIGRPWSIR